MRRRGFIILPVVIAVAACARPSTATSPPIGTWVPQSAEFDGDALPVATFRGAVLLLTADTYAFGADQGTYASVSNDPPAQMDIHGVAGPNAGRTILAIQQRDGDALTICYRLGEGGRPDGFTTTKGSRLLLVRYRRAT